MSDPSTDPAIVNIPLAKRYRGGLAGIDRELDRWKAEQAKEARAKQKADHQRRLDARATQRARPKLTAEDVKGARIVRDEYGWHEVVRVSAKSVTVKTAYSWTDRIPLDRLLEAHR